MEREEDEKKKKSNRAKNITSQIVDNFVDSYKTRFCLKIEKHWKWSEQ